MPGAPTPLRLVRLGKTGVAHDSTKRHELGEVLQQHLTIDTDSGAWLGHRDRTAPDLEIGIAGHPGETTNTRSLRQVTSEAESGMLRGEPSFNAWRYHSHVS